MVTTNVRDRAVTKPWPFPAVGALEGSGILVLGALVAYFLAISWRKWPDPIVDTGQQWYAVWRLAHGSQLYHEFAWNYGPLTVTLNASLFRLFGAGMMVLVTANLIIYGLILTLAYLAFRKAWGPLAAFAASAVFICVFSFSRLSDIGNYNFATPYTHESTHGLLLMLVTAWLVVRWQVQASRRYAFLLGLCGGLAAVMKPEFMLAGGLLGITALILRGLHRQRIQRGELLLLVSGIALPTLIFTVWYARFESWQSAAIHASQAWWLVFFHPTNPALLDQQFFSGLDHPWQNAALIAQVTPVALLAIGAIWAAGWFVNRPWPLSLRVVATLAALALTFAARIERGWIEVGRCFPALIAIVFVAVVVRLRREFRNNARADDRTVMALVLVVLAGAMMARMPLFPRVYHFGFFQAALAGMVLAAVLVGDLPAWTGAGSWGRRISAWGGILLLAQGCCSIAAQSRNHQAGQTTAIGSGADRFYAFNDETASEVNWALTQLRPIAPEATVLVLPAGAMINYLSRHVSPLPDLGADEAADVSHLAQSPPDYVVLLAGDLPELRLQAFGAEGHQGYLIYQWLREHYTVEAQGPRTYFLRHQTGASTIPAK